MLRISPPFTSSTPRLGASPLVILVGLALLGALLYWGWASSSSGKPVERALTVTVSYREDYRILDSLLASNKVWALVN